MTETLPSLISAMAEPEFYPHGPAQVELRQTHISYVFLAGEYVYKVKKPVRFSFLDYSTRERRLHFCREEVRLNRRLAPKVYLGVVPIYRSGEGFALGEDTVLADRTTVVEHAVKMRRLPEDRMLNRLVMDRIAGKEDIRALVNLLVPFHRSAATERASLYGTPEAIRRRITDNFAETRDFIGRTIREKMFNRIQEYSLGFLAERASLLQDRVRDQKVREGHGDLRTEHVCVGDEIVVFDCIEFDERLRYCDVASEVAFLAMDLDFLGEPELSECLAREYAETGDDELLSLLLPFYKSYRAYVRGKVESLKAQEQEVPEAGREKASAEARRYFRLAYRYARGAPKAAMLIVCGMIATGKSTVARMLSDLTGFRVISSDVVRKRLAQIPLSERVTERYRGGIYSDAFTQLTYHTLLEEAETCLKTGRGVIIDATFKKSEHRRVFMGRAADLGIPVFFLECQARQEELFRRLKQREEETGQISDADWQVYLRQRDEFKPFTDIPDQIHLTVNTEADLPDSIERLVESF
ncbi:MAG: AAA family ATPase [Deltaproteobacteria bacterium]|nr:AAA family ATPase [Deltaproteobacteria bacterium]